MDNNELLRRLRYALQLDDQATQKLLKLGQLPASIDAVGHWRLKDDDPDFIACPNEAVSAFLTGLIADRRGVQQGKPVPLPSKARSDNNTVLKSVKIALSMRSEDLQACMSAGGASLTVSEVNALLRKPDSRNFRQCGDQVLRQLFSGISQGQRDQS